MASLHPMALPARSRLHDPLEEFEDVLEACRRESVIHDPPRKFIIAIRLLEWFRSECEPNRTNAGRILMAIHHSYPPNFIKNLLNTMGPGEECWLKVFTILLMLKRGKDIGTFLKMGILDKRLPITEDHLLEKLQNILGRPLNEGNRQFATDFTSLQYQLLTTDSLDSENGRVLDSRIILPVCRYEPIKPDGSEKIFQIEIPCRSIPSKILKNVKAKPKRTAEDDDEKYHKFAIKTLRNPEEYHQETFAYSALKGREGVVQCLGFWEIKSPSGESDFHLLLEYGEYDLHEYFENFPPPSLPGDIIQFWKGLSHVAIALDKIHNMEIKYEQRTDSWFGWHLDIKPENILFCKGGWKIADPGFAIFVQHSDARRDENGLPVISLRGGTTTYGPPEQFIDRGKPVTQRFDVWSLGCVFSEAATWLLLGNRGVEQFRLVRKSVENGNSKSISFNEPRGDDCFHNKEGDVSTAVIAWHNYLRNSLRNGDCITGRVLDVVEKKMLLSSVKNRASSRDLVKRLKDIIDIAEKDENLSKYQPPKFFLEAFQAEQRKIGEEWANPPQLAVRRSNRYKSMRFEDVPTNDLAGQGNSAYDQANIHTPLLTAPLHGSDRFRDHGPHRGYTTSSQMTRDSLTVTTHGINPFDVQSQERTALRVKDEKERFNYWDALSLLESRGWVQKGTLERPREPGESERQTLPSPPISKSMSSSAPRSSQVNSSKSKSILASLLPRRGHKRPKNLISPPNQDESPTNPRSPRASFTSPSHQRASSDSTSNLEANAKYKTTDFDLYFNKRDIVFLLDNGSTMAEHWPRARELVAVLVALLHGQDDNGMEMYFTSSTEKFGPFVEPKQFVDIINLPDVKPKQILATAEHDKQDSTSISNDPANDIRKVLDYILTMVGKETYDRKLLLIILTDGIWKDISDKKTVANTIVNKLAMWRDYKFLNQMMADRGLSLQFVQFGNDPDATEVFEYMDNDLRNSSGAKQPDIIDVEPATGNIKKMILGSLSDEWDEGGHTTVASDDSQSVISPPEYRTGMSPIKGTIMSPTAYPDSRYSTMYEDPAEYASPGGQKFNFNSDGDPYFGTGSQFGISSNPMPRGRVTTPPSTSVSRNMIGTETPSGSGTRKRQGTKDSSSTVMGGILGEDRR